MRVAFTFFIALCLLSVTLAFRACEHARILGATYGTKDITSAVAHEYNLGIKSFDATSAKWGSTLAGSHTMTLVYEKCGNIAVQTSQESGKITLP